MKTNKNSKYKNNQKINKLTKKGNYAELKENKSMFSNILIKIYHFKDFTDLGWVAGLRPTARIWDLGLLAEYPLWGVLNFTVIKTSPFYLTYIVPIFKSLIL